MTDVAARIAVLLPSLDGGGAERSLATVAGGLAARGHDVTLLLGRASGPFLAGLAPAVRVLDLAAPSLPLALPRLVRQLRRQRPQVLLAAIAHANVVAALAHRIARSPARLVLSERAHASSVIDGVGGVGPRVTGALMRLTYPWADHVVAVSRGVADDLLARLPLDPARVSVLPNPVVDAALHERAAAVPAHPWLAHKALPVVLAAGRLQPQKDFGLLLDAFARLRRGRALRLVILGEGPDRAALLAQAQALGVGADVALPGFDANPFAAMRAADLFVLSSRYEGLPGVLIQAMACGARVVATDCPSGPREVLEDGRWGRLVPVGDAAALAAAMAAALDDPAPPDVRRRAADFGVERAIDAYARVLGVA